MRWFLGLTGYSLLVGGPNPALAGLANPYNPSSPAYALEHLGWGLFFGLAAGLTGLSLRSDRESGALARAWGIAGTLSLLHFLGVLLDSEPLIWLGFIAWGVVLPAASALAAGMFQRRLQAVG